MGTGNIFRSKILLIVGFDRKLTGLLLLSLLLALQFACFGGDDNGDSNSTPTVVNTVESTSIPSATSGVEFSTIVPVPTPTQLVVDPIPTVTATPIATIAPTIEPTATAVFDIQASKVRLRTCSVVTSGSGSNGTAPAPTPTPAASNNRALVTIGYEGGIYLSQINPITTALQALDVEFNSSWKSANASSSQTAFVYSFGTRLSHLCSALNLIDVPEEFIGSASLLAEALRVRHAWTAVALDSLQCCDDAKTFENERGNILTSEVIYEVERSILDTAQKYEIDRAELFTNVVTSDLLGIEIDVPGEFVISRNSIDMVIQPAVLDVSLEPDLLGPNAWQLGIALRVRRFRNRESFAPIEAVEWHESTFTSLGTLGPFSEHTLQGTDAVTFNVVNADISWNISVTSWVRDGFTYFVEVGCDDVSGAACTSISDVAQGLRLISE
jgi:hypothetical protein